MNVKIKGSDTVYPVAAVQAVYDWLENLLMHDLTGFMVVVDLVFNGMPPGDSIRDEYIAKGVLDSDGRIQTTRCDLTRLMVVNAADPMAIRLLNWAEIDAVEVA